MATNDDQGRCPICDWPMAAFRAEGCVPGDCSYRPRQGSNEWRRIEQRREELARREAAANVDTGPTPEG